MEEKSLVAQAHEFIDALEKYGKEQHRKVNVLKEAMEEILTIGVNTRDRNRMINCAFHSLAESEDGYEQMTSKEQSDLKDGILAEARPK
jgi:hypothetical protein